jgi:hypothetical protein
MIHKRIFYSYGSFTVIRIHDDNDNKMKFWEGKKCKCWYRLRFRYLHSLIVLKQAGMRVELNLGSLGYNAPCQHNIRKK